MRHTGISFLGLLALLFIGLKLGHLIDWSWWYVLLPLYAPLALVVFLLTLLGLVAVLIDVKTRK